MNNIKIGQKFSKLEVLEIIGKRKGSVLCKCECGQKRVFVASQLTRGHNTSCGCMFGKQSVTHNMSYSQFYRKWDSVNGRCYRKFSSNYSRYGGRGIKSDWHNNFQKFYDEMYDSYIYHLNKYGASNTTIERIDVNGNYCKENCKWATNKEQSINKSSNVYWNYNGTKLVTKQLERALGLPVGKLQSLYTRHKNKEIIYEMIRSKKIYTDLRFQPATQERRNKISDFYKRKRLFTEGQENELKQALSDQKIVELKS